jgi:L-arabinokinase
VSEAQNPASSAQAPGASLPSDSPWIRALSPEALRPASTLLRRLRAELAADFDFSKPIRISRAPGRLDVMGGIADYSGATVCVMPLDRSVALALQPRGDGQLQVFSFNLHDEHQPFTLRLPVEAITTATPDQLRRDFAEPGRKWAGYVLGCLAVLIEQKLLDPVVLRQSGMSIAVYSTVPMGAGLASSAALEVAAMMAFVDHFGFVHLRRDPMRLAVLCQQVEHHIVGAPCGIMDQVTSVMAETEMLLRLLCQPHELQPPLRLPAGIRALGINSGVRHSVGGTAYTRARCAAFMGHAMVLDKMREVGRAIGKELLDDPMRGYLANLDADDFKRYFRPHLPETMRGLEFLERYGPTIDTITTVHPDHEYHVQSATDHHVLEARRIRNFIGFIEQAARLPPDDPQRTLLLDKAGHLMYASHLSYTNDAQLGAGQCDLLVEMIRQREPDGFYGARITAGGCGGTVAVLADDDPRSDRAVAEIIAAYQQQTGKQAEAVTGTSPGASHLGTLLLG